MCGIAGIIRLDGQSVNTETIIDMLSCIVYRGPDESGVYIKNNIALGNVRLSIIDISTGQQPMCNENRSIWIVYNGELFNYIELRATLKRQGISFKTDSDTEVILKYYEKYGEKCLAYFNGQFAIAIWDNNKMELFMARDRVGIRPVFYYYQHNTFIFGSEIKSILTYPGLKAELDIQNLSGLFTFWANISPNTCFKNIFELSPGHYLKLARNKLEIKKYWELDFSPENQYKGTNLNTITDEFEEILTDSVRLRLRADVPVVAYLSGGIDSSATTCLIKKVTHDRLNTFSIGFSEKAYDESKYQLEVSAFLDTKHTSFQCTNEEIAEEFARVIWHTECPLLRTAPVPMYLLSKHVRENNIKVVITGEGADEMLGGYNIFKEMAIKRFWAKYPKSTIRPLLLRKLYPYIDTLQKQDVRMLRFFFGYKLEETDSPFYSHLLRWNNTSKLIGYLNPDHQKNIRYPDPYEILMPVLPTGFNNFSHLAKAQWLESTIFMSGYLLSSQGDRVSMANSVEGRYPFLDYRVIEFCSKLHPDLKLNGLNEKYLLKKAMVGKLPESIVNRSKQAYRAPIKNVFLNPGPKVDNLEYISSANINDIGVFDPTKVTGLISKISNGISSELDEMALTAIISTQILYNQFIKNFKKTNRLDNCVIIIN